MSEDKKVFSEAKISYLQMIQGNIDRMSTSSAIFKGFSATIIAGISTLSFNIVNRWILVLSFVPVLCFLILDVYYLRLERCYRFLYEKVRKGVVDPDFDLSAPKGKDILKMEKKTSVRILSCIVSPSILLFYLPMLSIAIIVIVFKFTDFLK